MSRSLNTLVDNKDEPSEISSVFRSSFPAQSRDADEEPWRLFVRAVAERSRGKVAGYQIGADPRSAARWRKRPIEHPTSSKIELLEREIDVMQREQKLRATTYYADAGNRLRDSKKYTDDQQKLNDDIDRKKKELDAAKAELDKMKDDARKLGLRIS